MFGLIDSFSFIWDRNDIHFSCQTGISSGNSEGDQHRAQTKVPRPQRPLTPYTYVNGRVMMTLAVTLVWKF